jgi:hypothetical protein
MPRCVTRSATVALAALSVLAFLGLSHAQVARPRPVLAGNSAPTSGRLASEPYHAKATVLPTTGEAYVPLDPVPAGKLLVIEYVNVNVFIPTGQKPIAGLRLEAGQATLGFPVSFVRTLGPNDIFHGSFPTLIIAEGGQVPTLYGSGVAGTQYYYYLAGYLIDAP